jgi:3-methylfumaryl-CoA hydratase
MTAPTEAQIAEWRGTIGRRHQASDFVLPDAMARFAATLDWPAPRAGESLPGLWHYGLFLDTTPTSQLGPDGHPPRGGFMPPITLPSRMFAGARLNFVGPLVCGKPAQRTMEIASVDHREGKSGDLILVGVRVTVSQDAGVCVEEEQTIVYRGGSGSSQPMPLPRMAADAPAPDWTPSTRELFRYSAMTFNTHRIHYDLRYTQEEEGYPSLVVHGPLIATRLCGEGERAAGPLKTFQFRAEAPLFVDLPVTFERTIEGRTIRIAAKRCDGVTAMSATATF